MSEADKIISLELVDEGNPSPMLAEERRLAIEGILEFNSFKYLKAPQSGPYTLKLSVEDAHLVFRLKDKDGQDLPILALSPRPYRKLIQDYFMMVESYEQVRIESPYKLEAIDMGRRGIHNEGARLLRERLKDKIELDFETARRFFTLICVLHLSSHRILP